MSYIKSLIIIFGICLLCQCNKVNHPQTNNRMNGTPFSMPAPAYLAMAERQNELEKQNLLLLASGRLIYDGQWREGKRILNSIKTTDPVRKDEMLILYAKAELTGKQPRRAINYLSKVKNREELTPFYQEQYHLLLAQAYEKQKLSIESVNERVKLDKYLASESEKISNRRQLWLTLTKMPAEELTSQVLERGPGTPLGGWMQLASIARMPYEPKTMVDHLERWRYQHPDHPANSILPSSIPSMLPWLNEMPQRVALLLPLSGPLASPGKAVLDGFMAAKQEHRHTSMRILTYDTNQGNAKILYQQALADGAQYIVGPLSKNEVAEVAALEHPVPTLLLNDADHLTKPNAYQFGLSPANEARQLALKAANDGYRHALVIAPEGKWGTEVTEAFMQQWQKGGGELVDSLVYSKSTDLNKTVRQFLHVNDSEKRAAALRKIIGNKLTSVTRRRQDFDMVFLLAYPSKARQIMPLLRYYYAGDVPVYSISTVYGGVKDTTRNQDLDGIIFCDMPWVFQTEDSTHKNWPESLNSYNRLYALGKDSYALATQLNQLLLFPAMGVNESSGILYLNQAQQIARIVAWGQFKNGQVELI